MKTLCSFLTAGVLLLVLPVFAVQAATTSVKCDKKSLAGAIDRLDKAEPNIVNITGDCNEDIVVSGHKDLKLIGHDGASITATVYDDDPDLGLVNSTTALAIENSKVTLQGLTINGGYHGVECFTSSDCIFRDVTIPRGWWGVSAQDNSKLHILGSSTISNALSAGVAAYGASHLVMGPDTWNNWSAGETGPVITGNDIGVWVQDGSFFRSDNVSITYNNWGIFAQRDVTYVFAVSCREHVDGRRAGTEYDLAPAC